MVSDDILFMWGGIITLEFAFPRFIWQAVYQHWSVDIVGLNT